MRGLLKAGFIISIVVCALCFIAGIIFFVAAPFEGDKVKQAELIGYGVYCIVEVACAVFSIIVSAKANKAVNAGSYSTALCVLTIISGIICNVVNIPGGILMIVNKNKKA